jgi:predicted HAD superfamily Cof-like phosphohydrolase
MSELTVHPTIADESIEVMDLNEEVIATLRFRVSDIDDVRHMLITAVNVADRHRMSEVRHVLVAQADAISKGLHIRDHDFPDLLGDVNAFHAKFGQEYVGKPRLLPEDLHDFRVKFHDEETHEYRDEYPRLVDAVDRKDRRDVLNAMELQLDALCDAIWVVLGTADLQFGRRVFFEAWRRVVTANMAKVRVEVAEDGTRNSEETGRAPKYDIGKPPGWTAPDHRDLVTDNAIFDEIFGQAREIPSGYSDTRTV